MTIDFPWQPGEEKLVNVEDCERVTRQLQYTLEVEEVDYKRLEVSSPGIDRPLFTPAQFARFAGEQAKVQLRLPVDGRRRVQGRIVRVEGDSIVLAPEDGVELTLAHDNIEKARLVPDLVALGLAAQPKPTGPDGKRRKAKTKES